MKKLTTKIQVLYGLGVGYAIIDQIFAQWAIQTISTMHLSKQVAG